jgi:hypothetical protein
MKLNAFLDRQQTLRKVRCCPPLQRLEFFACLKLALAELGDRHPETAYIHDSFFQQLSDECLKLCGIDPDWCTPAMVVQFLYRGIRGNSPDIVALNLPESSDQPTDLDELIGLERATYNRIAALMSTECTIAASMHIASTVPWDVIEGILQARIDLVAPESKEASGWKEFAKEVGAIPLKDFLNFSGSTNGANRN